MAIFVRGYITEEGEIKVNLPPDHPVGEVSIMISEPEASMGALQPFTLGEIMDYVLAEAGDELDYLTDDEINRLQSQT